uniref:Uncharacterized protein n=1 Tax=Rhizophora mucronata TaxID=61149 RepID=A0A2P2PP29_RHIMU
MVYGSSNYYKLEEHNPRRSTNTSGPLSPITLTNFNPLSTKEGSRNNV